MVCYTLAWLYVMGWPLRKTVLMSETCYHSQDCGLKYGERMQYKVALNGGCVCVHAHMHVCSWGGRRASERASSALGPEGRFCTGDRETERKAQDSQKYWLAFKREEPWIVY